MTEALQAPAVRPWVWVVTRAAELVAGLVVGGGGYGTHLLLATETTGEVTLICPPPTLPLGVSVSA